MEFWRWQYLFQLCTCAYICSGRLICSKFDRDQYFATDEVKSLFEELQAVGIYHTSVESAASFLNEKYESIEKWWEMPETKSASDKVKNYFFTTSNNFTKEWTQELVALRDKILKDKLNQGALAGGRKKKEG